MGISDNDKLFNFDSFTNAFNMVNVIFDENGYGAWLLYNAEQTDFSSNTFMNQYGHWIVVAYFIIAYILQVWILCNLMTSIFLESYSFHLKNWISSPQILEQLKESI